MSFLPSVIREEFRGGSRIHVTFNDDSGKTIDFREWLKGPLFEPLRHGRVADRRDAADSSRDRPRLGRQEAIRGFRFPVFGAGKPGNVPSV